MAQFDPAIEDYKRAMDFKGLYSEAEIEIMQEDINTIEKRKESQEHKLQGDIAFSLNKMNEALENYTKALELDPSNEYALSNIGVIYLKRQDYQACLNFTNQALEVLEEFHPDTKEFHKENLLEIKLLQRRAKCLEEKDDLEGAKADLDRAQFLDPKNPTVRECLAKI